MDRIAPWHICHLEPGHEVQAPMSRSKRPETTSRSALGASGDYLIPSWEESHTEESPRLHSVDVWALNNRRLVSVKMGKREEARRDAEPQSVNPETVTRDELACLARAHDVLEEGVPAQLHG